VREQVHGVRCQEEAPAPVGGNEFDGGGHEGDRQGSHHPAGGDVDVRAMRASANWLYWLFKSFKNAHAQLLNPPRGAAAATFAPIFITFSRRRTAFARKAVHDSRVHVT
jgi:hypothetical protein